MIRSILITIVILLAVPAHAQWPTENEWAKQNVQRYYAVNGVRLWDGTQCDYVTDTHAIEIDWAKNGKWAEAIGQALYYAEVLNKKPAIILLVRLNVEPNIKALQKGYVYRCQTVCAKFGIKLYVELVKKNQIVAPKKRPPIRGLPPKGQSSISKPGRSPDRSIDKPTDHQGRHGRPRGSDPPAPSLMVLFEPINPGEKSRDFVVAG